MLYRRSREEMPANAEEIHEAEEEGIQFHFLTAPVAAIGNGKVSSLRCLRMELGEPDASGRRRPVPVSRIGIRSAHGYGDFGHWFERRPGILEQGTRNIETCCEHMGDAERRSYHLCHLGPGSVHRWRCATGAATVIKAIAAGKEVAISIDRYLRGVDMAEGRMSRNRHLRCPACQP